jgi:Cu/Ag efflux pump CusA
MVMVVYLDEAVDRMREFRGTAFHYGSLVAATKEGARLRLRPKVMTVATIIASLLPVFWSERIGAEIMRPIAIPILGGMLSSLIHVLIVTPVLFVWLRGRRVEGRGDWERQNRLSNFGWMKASPAPSGAGALCGGRTGGSARKLAAPTG